MSDSLNRYIGNRNRAGEPQIAQMRKLLNEATAPGKGRGEKGGYERLLPNEAQFRTFVFFVSSWFTPAKLPNEPNRPFRAPPIYV
jgi:hypothetical protein